MFQKLKMTLNQMKIFSRPLNSEILYHRKELDFAILDVDQSVRWYEYDICDRVWDLLWIRPFYLQSLFVDTSLLFQDRLNQWILLLERMTIDFLVNCRPDDNTEHLLAKIKNKFQYKKFRVEPFGLWSEGFLKNVFCSKLTFESVRCSCRAAWTSSWIMKRWSWISWAHWFLFALSSFRNHISTFRILVSSEKWFIRLEYWWWNWDSNYSTWWFYSPSDHRN